MSLPFNPQIPNPKTILHQYLKELHKDSESKRAFGDEFRVVYEKYKDIQRLQCRALLWPIETHKPVENIEV